MAVTPEFELATLEVKKITGAISNDDLLQVSCGSLPASSLS